MKKLTVLTLLMMSMGIVLTGCTSNTDTDVDVLAGTDVVVEDVTEQIADRNEYQFELTIKGDVDLEMSSKIYKKGANSVMEIITMG
jgi:outer membrane biogenesis lipoprotein LolB